MVLLRNPSHFQWKWPNMMWPPTMIFVSAHWSSSLNRILSHHSCLSQQKLTSLVNYVDTRSLTRTPQLAPVLTFSTLKWINLSQNNFAQTSLAISQLLGFLSTRVTVASCNSTAIYLYSFGNLGTQIKELKNILTDYQYLLQEYLTKPHISHVVHGEYHITQAS